MTLTRVSGLVSASKTTADGTKLVRYGEQVSENANGLMYIIARLPWYAKLVDLLRSAAWNGSGNLRQSKIALREAITDLYKVVIEYQLLTFHDYHHKLKTFAKATAGLGEPWKDRLKSIRNAEAEIEKHMHHDFTTQMLGLLRGIKSGSEQVKDCLMSQLGREIELEQQPKLIAKFKLDHTHLNPDAYQEYYSISDPLEGSTQGIRSHKTFEAWQSGETRSLLMVANPGTGKSVLAISLQKELSTPNQTVCSFFFKDLGGF